MFLISFLITFLYPFHTFADSAVFAKKGDFKFEVSIMHKDKFLCGGALINKTLIITAAHCVKYKNINELKIIAGATEQAQFGNEHKNELKNVVVHPRYRKISREFDIALLILKWNIKNVNSVEPINIISSDYRIEGGNAVKLVFWHHLNGLRMASVETGLWEPDNCTDLNIYGPYDFNYPLPLTSENTFCAEIPKDMCFADDAGSLLVNNQLLGIVSWNLHCDEKDKPLVLTNMIIFSAWIKRVLKEIKL